MTYNDLLCMNSNHSNLKLIVEAILMAAGGETKFKSQLPLIVRQAYDEVIDTPRSGRRSLLELNEIERNYIGAKVVVLLRSILRFPKGKLDMRIEGVDIDVIYTTSAAWKIPIDTASQVSIIIKTDELKSICSFGLFVPILSNYSTQDGKWFILKVEDIDPLWIINNERYPESFWEKVDPKIAEAIFVERAGTKRLEVLFRKLLEIPISRNVIAGIAQQHDYMKRIRKNGGARDKLAKEEIAILSGKADSKIIQSLGLPRIGREEFYSYKCKSDADRILLLNHGKIE